MRSYEDLEIWRLGIALTTRVYALSEGFPRDERFGIVAQMRRAAVSVPSNIAEGAGRGTPADYRRFLRMAIGACNELDTLFEIAELLGYLEPDGRRQLASSLVQLRRMTHALATSLE